MSVNLVTFRKARGWSQTDLAHAAGVEKSTVSRIESGARPNPRGGTLIKLAAALDVKSTDLTGETASMPSSIAYQGVTHVPVLRYLHASTAPSWRDTGERLPLPQVSSILGHSSIAVTAKFYARTLTRRQDRLAQLAEEIDAALDAGAEQARSEAPKPIRWAERQG